MWFLVILLFAGTTILSGLLAKRPKGPAPAGIGDFQVPTAEEGRVIPVIYGTVLNSGPNVVWWGDLKVSAMKQSSGGFLGIGAKSVTTGYKYGVGMQMALCHGQIDALLGIQVGGKNLPLPSPTSVDGGFLYAINQPSLFGGDTQEGGIAGPMKFFLGTPTQSPSSYLTTQFGENAPAYHGLCHCVLEGVYVGTSPYIKAWAFVMQRCPNGLSLTGNKHQIAGPTSEIVYNGVGTGSMTGVSNGSSGFSDVYTISATDATHFSVVGDLTGVVGTAVVGTPFTSTAINFTINAGGTAFQPGDEFGVGFTGGFDANPACIIYDLMVNTRYGLAIADARIDLDSFVAVAETLYTENLGESLLLDTSAAADDTISDILRHGNLVLFTDPASGLWTLRAIRADYDVDTLVEFTDDDILEAPEISRPSFPDLLNEVKVEYIDRAANFQTRIAQAQDLAVYSQQLFTQSETVQYHGLSNTTIAQLIAQRDLKAVSYPLAQVSLKVNRKGWQLRPGSPFKMTWSGEGITGMVLRVAEISYGALDDTNLEITIKAAEDLFGLVGTAYGAPGGSEWTDPIVNPQAPAAQALMEVPYAFVGDIPTTGLVTPYVADLVSRGDGISTGFEIWRMNLIDEGGGVFTETSVEQLYPLGVFVPSGLLAADYPHDGPSEDNTGFVVTLAGSIDLDELTSTDESGLSIGKNLVYFEGYDPGGTSGGAELLGELMSWKTVTDNGDGTLTISGVKRGGYDTLPIDHLAGARVWFISEGATAIISEPGRASVVGSDTIEPVIVRNLPRNSLGDFSYDDSVRIATSIDLSKPRAAKPYPPGKIRVNGVEYRGTITPNVTTPIIRSSDLTLQWAPRNRYAQWQFVPSQSDATYPTTIPPYGSTQTIEGTMTVEVYIGTTLAHTFSGITGDFIPYRASNRVLDDSDGSKAVFFRIIPTRVDDNYGTLTGTERQTTSFLMTGLGIDPRRISWRF